MQSAREAELDWAHCLVTCRFAVADAFDLYATPESKAARLARRNREKQQRAIARHKKKLQAEMAISEQERQAATVRPVPVQALACCSFSCLGLLQPRDKKMLEHRYGASMSTYSREHTQYSDSAHSTSLRGSSTRSTLRSKRSRSTTRSESKLRRSRRSTTSYSRSGSSGSNSSSYSKSRSTSTSTSAASRSDSEQLQVDRKGLLKVFRFIEVGSFCALRSRSLKGVCCVRSPK